MTSDCQYLNEGRCHSCPELMTPYQHQLLHKQRSCEQVLAIISPLSWLPICPSQPIGFRNKAKMVVSGHWSAPLLGILDAQQQPVDLTACLLYPKAIQDAFVPLRDFITQCQLMPYHVQTKQGALKYLLLTYSASHHALMCRFVLSHASALPKIQQHLPRLLAALPILTVVSVNIQPVHMAVLEGDEEVLLTEKTALTMVLNDIPLQVKPRSFFQTNDAVAAALYRQAQDWIAEIQPKHLWDLFCGVGGFALHAAQVMQGRITGVEVSAEAIDSARQTAQLLNLPLVTFRALTSDEFALNGSHASFPDMVVVNPPRRGIGSDLCQFLNDAQEIQTIIYSSCNAASLAVDCALLSEFIPIKARVFDMFPHTHHAEVLLLLSRKRV